MSKIVIDKHIIEEMYAKHKNIVLAAKELRIGRNTFSRLMKEYGINTIGSQGARKHHYNEAYFETIDTQDKAYWLGFIYADGCVYKGSDNHSYRLQINLKESDKSHLEKFQKALGSCYKIGHSNKTQSVSLKINSTKLCTDLINHGVVCNKSLIIKPPKIANEFIPHFIRGLFDGDGSISWVRGRIPHASVATGSIELAEWLRKYMPNFNIYIYKRKHDLFSIESQSREIVRNFHAMIYQNANTFLERKYIKFNDIVYNRCPL